MKTVKVIGTGVSRLYNAGQIYEVSEVKATILKGNHVAIDVPKEPKKKAVEKETLDEQKIETSIN